MNIEDELICLAKLGDNNAISKLLTKYKHLVKNVARKYYLVGGDSEDLMQEGMIGLYDAILSYDMTKNDHFEAYAHLLIQRNILNAIKRDSALKFSPLNDGAHLNHQGELEHDESSFAYPMEQKTPEEILLQQERDRAFEEAMETILSDLEKRIVRLYLTGKSYSEIAALLGIRPKSVDNALSRIKKKLSFLKNQKE